MKYTLNYDTGDYEWMDKSGYSYDTGEYSYNFVLFKYLFPNEFYQI